MGDSMTGSSSTEQMSTLTGGQQGIAQLLEQLGPDVISQLMGMATGDLDEMFQKAYIDPAMMAFEQDFMPQIQERFGGDTGASSALNQTLAQSAENMGTMLGSQMGQFAQQQQGMQANILMNMLGQTMSPQFENVVTQKGGWLDPTLQFAGKAAGAYYGV